MGILPPGVELPPRNPLGPTQTEVVQTWDELPADEQRLYARMMEVYAGFISHTDHQIGRLLSFLEEIDALDNTLLFLVSDNGASGEGGPSGSVNSHRYFNRVPEHPEQMLAAIDDLGGPKTYNHYPLGWTMAGCTPLKMWKRYVWEGGISDPCIVHWPRRIRGRGETRGQYHHAVDLLPTVLEAIGLEAPTEIKGVKQKPLEGVSMAYTWEEPAAPTRKQVQYYEMLGQRAIWVGGWKAVALHEPLAETGHFDKDVWALYHTDEDPAELHDLAAAYPEKLQELIDRWWVEARKYQVLPLDDRMFKRAISVMAAHKSRGRYVYYPHAAAVPEWDAPNVKNLPHTITAEVVIPPGGAEGVLVAHGSRFGGYTLYVKDGRLVYTHNYVGDTEFTVISHTTVPSGPVSLRFRFQVTGLPQLSHGKGAPGLGLLFINRRPVGVRYIPRTTPILYDPDDGLTVGRDGLSAVSTAYTPPFPFTGTVQRVVIEVSGIARHLNELAMAIMARQ
jgi:arylsulfatase